ncbi:MAG: hypothetical protein CVV25_10225 [Ignavibacteriae bacterium HGW-Ignavibacteriae-4]|nr:MAG: hypothetical protein CVV25_10225 [Ignavibacteriae bacterium HGW-Ignavibacteriae-4]
MKNILLTIFLAVLASTSTNAIDIDTLWYRYSETDVLSLDFTPIEFWEVQQGIKEFFVPSETIGDYNYNEEYLVFAQDSTPKLLDWQTREVVEGFGKMESKIERIKTAKSKNEFMAKLSQDSNIIYFWDINTKQLIDNINFVYSFEKNNYKWKKTVHEYGYVGKNDELIYVITDDANDVIENINPMFRENHYYVNFYSRETKELVDSIYSFTNTNEHYGGFNKMQVMNDRTKIAWNHNGGEINFYDINQKRFYDKLVFDERDFIEASDIKLNKNNNVIGITKTESCCRYIKLFDIDSKNLIYQFGKGSWQNIAFSNNDNFLTSNISPIIVLFPSHISTTSVIDHSDNNNFTISPNPATNTINIKLKWIRIY